MGEGKLYKVEIATPAKIRYQQRILSYLYEILALIEQQR